MTQVINLELGFATIFGLLVVWEHYSSLSKIKEGCKYSFFMSVIVEVALPLLMRMLTGRFFSMISFPKARTELKDMRSNGSISTIPVEIPSDRIDFMAFSPSLTFRQPKWRKNRSDSLIQRNSVPPFFLTHYHMHITFE